MSNFYRRGEDIFLYVKFKDDKNNPISVENARVKIVHEKKGELFTDLDWTQLKQLSNNEYFTNHTLSYDSDYATYQVLYSGDYQDKEASTIEEFKIIPDSQDYIDVIKIFGFVNQLRNGYSLIGVEVKVFSEDNGEMVYQGLTKDDGDWEIFVYPGDYKITFSKYGFTSQEFTFQVGIETTEIQFDNVSLESLYEANKGNGSYQITDKYTTREGMPIVGLDIKAYNVLDINQIYGTSKTDEEGNWELFLDPGIYLLKVTGSIFGDEFDQIFRVKVSDEGEFSFENLDSNTAIAQNPEGEISQGNGSIELSDIVIDSNGSPIVDVQVNIFHKNNMNNIIAQDYTNPLGRWTVYLNPGNYVIEYYHPKFDVILEDKTV